MPARPNVVVFFTDQQRWDTCGCYGSPLGITPNLDAMAKRGTKAEYSFTVQPVCGPARSCFQTGLYATQTGCWKNSIPLKPDARTLAHEFSEAGYRTGYIGKWHLATEPVGADGKKNYLAPVPPEARGGYQDWYGANVLEFFSEPFAFRVQDNDGNVVERPGYRVDGQTELVLEYIDERAKGPEPFFLFISYIEPHHQNAMKRYVGPEGSRERFKDAWVPEDLRALNTGDWKEQLADYYGCCASLDQNLGRVRGKLEALGIDKNTVLMFCSDHGSHFRTRNGEYKRSCHESSIRVPTVLQGPGFDGGRTISEPVELVDWPATLLDAAGLPLPNRLMGRSLKPLAQGEKPHGWREEAFVQISESQIGRAVRTPRWTYFADAPADFQDGAGGSKVYVDQYLYDNEADPHQIKNLVKDPAHLSTLETLRARLKARMAAAGEAAPEFRTAE